MVGVQDQKYRRAVIFVVWVLVSVVSCKDPIGGTGKAPVFLVIESSPPYGLSSDVYNPAVTGHVADDTKFFTINSVKKNPDATLNTFSDVIIQEYRVHYYRPDGNPNVPEPFFVQLHQILSAGGVLDLEIIMMRADAKLKSPLVELAFGGGEGEIYMNGVVEFFGEDLAGNAVSGSVVVPIRAKDF